MIELESKGLLTRVHGGAKSNQHLKYREIPHEEKLYQNIEAKRTVAKKAVELIEDGDTIFLGRGLLWRCWLRKSAISICA